MSRDVVPIVVVIAVGLFAVVMITIGSGRQRREMDRLAEEMWEADRAWRRAMIDYLTASTKTPKPPTKTQSEAITVELEVVKPEQVRGEWKDDG